MLLGAQPVFKGLEKPHTGTPEGVGAGMKPPSYLKPGDVVRCEIDGIGAIENTVIAPR